jgi:hypothetical protein
VGGRKRERRDRSQDGDLGRSTLTSQLINGEARETIAWFATPATSLHIPDDALITDTTFATPHRHIAMAGLPDLSRYVSTARGYDLLVMAAPEPVAWALMLLGFGLVVATCRRQGPLPA